jgi:hypothetical protein
MPVPPRITMMTLCRFPANQPDAEINRKGVGNLFRYEEIAADFLVNVSFTLVGIGKL